MDLKSGHFSDVVAKASMGIAKDRIYSVPIHATARADPYVYLLLDTMIFQDAARNTDGCQVTTPNPELSDGQTEVNALEVLFLIEKEDRRRI